MCWKNEKKKEREGHHFRRIVEKVPTCVLKRMKDKNKMKLLSIEVFLVVCVSWVSVLVFLSLRHVTETKKRS